MEAMRHEVRFHGGFFRGCRLVVVITALLALKAASSPAEDQTILADGPSQLSAEFCRQDIFYLPIDLEWDIYPLESKKLISAEQPYFSLAEPMGGM